MEKIDKYMQQLLGHMILRNASQYNFEYLKVIGTEDGCTTEISGELFGIITALGSVIRGLSIKSDFDIKTLADIVKYTALAMNTTQEIQTQIEDELGEKNLQEMFENLFKEKEND